MQYFQCFECVQPKHRGYNVIATFWQCTYTYMYKGLSPRAACARCKWPQAPDHAHREHMRGWGGALRNVRIADPVPCNMQCSHRTYAGTKSWDGVGQGQQLVPLCLLCCAAAVCPKPCHGWLPYAATPVCHCRVHDSEPPRSTVHAHSAVT